MDAKTLRLLAKQKLSSCENNYNNYFQIEPFIADLSIYAIRKID